MLVVTSVGFLAVALRNLLVGVPIVGVFFAVGTLLLPFKLRATDRAPSVLLEQRTEAR
jgi:hypothetical protein